MTLSQAQRDWWDATSEEIEKRRKVRAKEQEEMLSRMLTDPPVVVKSSGYDWIEITLKSGLSITIESDEKLKVALWNDKALKKAFGIKDSKALENSNTKPI